MKEDRNDLAPDWLDPGHLIESRRAQQAPLKQRIAEQFFGPKSDGKRFLLGRNDDAAALAECADICAYVDDFADAGTTWHGLPVIGMADLPDDAWIVNCVSSQWPVSAVRRLKAIAAGRYILSYADLLLHCPEQTPLPRFIAETRHSLTADPEHWCWLASTLADEASRSVLRDLISFRLTGDPAFMTSYKVDMENQYFDDVAPLYPERHFVDCGAFTGDTTELFIKKYPDFAGAYLFEPSTDNIASAKARLKDVPNLVFDPRGVSDRPGSLRFDPDAGSASAVSDQGAVEIDVTTVDLAVDRPSGCIKMDLEGWEEHALKGSKAHITQHHPTLALAVYHHPADFWRLPQYVMEQREDYSLFLRHYTEGWAETVLYAVPRR